MLKSSSKFALAIVAFAIASLAVTALALPVLSNAKAKAKTTKCRNNLKQLALGLQLSLTDDHYPLATEWATWLHRSLLQTKTPKISQCPADFQSESNSSYVLNDRLAGKAKAEVHPDTVVLFEAEAGVSMVGGPERLLTHPRHNDKVNVALADGTVHEISPSQLNSLRWDP